MLTDIDKVVDSSNPNKDTSSCDIIMQDVSMIIDMSQNDHFANSQNDHQGESYINNSDIGIEHINNTMPKHKKVKRNEAEYTISPTDDIQGDQAYHVKFYRERYIFGV
jgi:hypothetical protein